MVKRLLLELGYRYRKQAKELLPGTYVNRNLQFHIITILILSMSVDSPLISIDCKKRTVGESLPRGEMLHSSPHQGLWPRL